MYTRLDNDDLLSRDWVRLSNIYAQKAKEHILVEPTTMYKFVMSRKSIRITKTRLIKTKPIFRTSNFALCVPANTKGPWLYSGGHVRMGQYVEPCKVLPGIYSLKLIHNLNWYFKVTPNDKPNSIDSKTQELILTEFGLDTLL